MDKLIINEKNVNKEALTVFLCGSAFRNDKDDKRIVLKDFINKYHKSFNVIILEENFIFAKRRKRKLSYDEIFMSNLYDIETMMGLLSDKIIILHESISTAAELGIFASNSNLSNKLCVMKPHRYTIEEEKMSRFISLAFLREKQAFEVVEFYPVTKRNKVSSNKKDYHTYFLNNKIGLSLSKEINKFLKHSIDNKVNMSISELKSKNRTKTFSYFLEKKSKKIVINLPSEVLKVLVMSIFTETTLKQKVRSCNTINELVALTKMIINDILYNTVKLKTSSDIKNYKTSFNIVASGSTQIDLGKAIGYVYYLLQANGYIVLPQIDEKSKEVIKATIGTDFTSRVNTLYSEVLKKYESPKTLKFLGSIDIFGGNNEG